MRFSKGLMSAAIAAALLVPALTQAAGLTSSQISAVINLLQSFSVDAHTIATVQAVLNGNSSDEHGGGNMMPWSGASTTPSWSNHASTTPWGNNPGQEGKSMCITLNRNLSEGSHGDDVRQLQQMLAQDPEDGFTASTTGFFGPMTAKALIKFQLHNGIASSSTGTAGPLTRGFFERHCGEGLGGGDGKGNDNQGENHGGSQQGIMIAMVFGTISANNGSTITVQNGDSKSVVVNITASTTIMVAATSSAPTVGTSANLVVGKTVSVQGPHAQDGSINATRITVGVPLPSARPSENSNDR